MPTDQLLHPFDGDSDMDRALRDLLPPMPRSMAWEAHQRETLLTFIETGDVRVEPTTPVSFGAATITVDAPSPKDRRRRAAVVLGMAAAAVLLIAGLVTAPRWVGQEVPSANVPASAPATAVSSTDIDRFPIAPSVDEVVAFLMPQNSDDWPRRTSAFVARIDPAGVITEPIVIEVIDGDECERLGCVVLDRVEIEGRAATVYEVGAGPDFRIRSLVIPDKPGTLTVTVTGADPVGFVNGIGGSPVRLLPDTSAGEIAFELAELPDGYQVVIAPTPYARGSYQAGLTWAGPGGADAPVAVIVQPNSELLQLGRLGPIEPVDLGDVTGWTYDLGVGSPVIWQVSPTTWASVTGAPTRDAAVEIARSLRFTDRSTWEAMYDVSIGLDELPAIPVATGDVPVTTAPALIALEEIGGLPTDVPIPCGSIPPRDEIVGAPAVASTPQDALAAFIETVEPGLWPNGWIHTWNGEDDDPKHRFDYRREDGELVTVVYVEAVDGGWAAIRWLSTPC